MKRKLLLTSGLFSLASLVAMIVFAMTAGAPRTTAGETPENPLVIDDFEDGNDLTLFNTPWVIYNDAGVGGKSSVQSKIIDGGANNSKKALRLSGKVTADFEHGFAGAAAAFDKQRRVQDMTRFTGVSFYCRGDDNVYQVRVLTAGVKDHNDFLKQFTASKQWLLIKIPFSSLVQSPYWGKQVKWTGKDLVGIAFQNAESPLENYRLEIDEISFY
jgi:licheninase